MNQVPFPYDLPQRLHSESLRHQRIIDVARSAKQPGIVDYEVNRESRRVFAREALRELTPADRILFERFGQGPLVDLPYRRIHHAFEAQVAAQPQALAARHLNESISYAMLDRQATRLAALLAEQGVRSGDNVAIFLKRSIPMLVGILATLKLGAAYVPQDVGVAPESQLRHIIGAASTKVILTLSHLRDFVPVPAGHVCINIDEVMRAPFDGRPDPLLPVEPLDDPAARCFILFTSGTTGKPNGVQVTHTNVCNILLTAPGSLGMAPGRKVAQLLNIAFDMAAWEILGALAHGATLIIRDRDFTEAARQADVLIATPSILSRIDHNQCRHIKVVAVAGEPCPKPLADTWASFCTFYNSCGPTETTIVNTMQHYRPSSMQLTIGKPTPNNTVYILDEHRRPCAIGDVGEMWAGGTCVTAGYLSNEQLTADRYAPDPFLGDGHVMFRTRDLGRWTANGELEHLGRSDDQVKVRGFRVELDAVSAALESLPGCTQAVTMKLDDANLVAFVRPHTVDLAAARRQVAAVLPYYAVPAQIYAVDAFPITDRGKIDKRTLLHMAEQQCQR